ncbi:SIR2 family NAD-dependent protein deacylase [Algoriphagus machipongonensis]|uniref:NAD-dependent protein deacylase n=1 Tax=Algoriphagus machipongonensis TaxID=388413 RepID=A3HRU1_9BACT|nr:Sir2 family NAD-dependent protein deacetylase [Algoriphagus machipongonensis]EAZ82559.1 NAD-dependent deacetylase [Algoriphagus machipongonensis]
MSKKKFVVLSGAGISQESGIKTFRDSNGLWENHDIMEVASPQGWNKNRALVQEFYNLRRKQAQECQPNTAHIKLAQLEDKFDITIITQNVDDLHERAGSSKVIHLHGELNKAQSSFNPDLVYPLDHWEIKEGQLCELGSQLRPHIVWFGEMVPKMSDAIEEAAKADIFLVIGTSLQVYPAASIIEYVPSTAKKFLIDLQIPDYKLDPSVICIEKKASDGMKELENVILEE